MQSGKKNPDRFLKESKMTSAQDVFSSWILWFSGKNMCSVNIQ